MHLPAATVSGASVQRRGRSTFFCAIAMRGEPTTRSYHVAAFELDAGRREASTKPMSIGTENDAPWDERAALEELNRLTRGIEEWRQRRKEVQAEFDRFVRGFRTTPPDREILDQPVNRAVGKTELALGQTLV